MARFGVKTMVTFYGEVEAENQAEAEAKGWEWEDELMYDGVYSIDVEELDDIDESETVGEGKDV